MAKQAKKMVRLGEVITCKCCGKQIIKEHTYQDYCSECSHKVMREKNTQAVRRFRDRKKQQELQQKQEIEAMKQRLAELEQQMAQQQVLDTTADTADSTDRSDS